MMDSTKRFSDRVEYYVRYRPHYPPGVLDVLRGDLRLLPPAAVADIGSGTGILTELLLRGGYDVSAVEPNREMRAAAERRLAAFPLFHSVDGTAEATTLASHSVDCITAAQAFHWFDPAKTGIEFRRILKPGGRVVLLWNNRRSGASPFLTGYESLIGMLASKYGITTSKKTDEDGIVAFFGGRNFTRREFENRQACDFEGLKGRLLSASYAPLEGQPGHEEMMSELKRIFDANQVDGEVVLEYFTDMYFGSLTG
jgi:SAM-dependent methyltransferase